MFDSERNKQHQKILCNEIRRLPNEAIKQLAVRIETLVQKAYSLNTHDYESTKMTEILMMTLTPQLQKIAIKKRASHPSSIREPDLGFRKLVDKLEQAEITVKLVETENFKLHYNNKVQTTTTQIYHINNSDTDLSEKVTEILNIYEKNPNFKGKPSFKKWCNYCRRYGHSSAECRQKQQDNQNKPQSTRNQRNRFISTRKKIKIYQMRTIRDIITGKPLPNSSNYSRSQSPYNSNYRDGSPDQRISRNFSQNRYSRSNSRNNHYRNNYSRSNSNRPEYSFDTNSHSQSRNRHYFNDRSRNSSNNRHRNYSNNRNRSYSNNRNQQYQNNRARYYSNNSSNHQRSIYNNYQNKSRDNSQNRNSNYNNRQRNYSQSPHRNNALYPDSQNKYRSNTPKHQRQINQVQTTEGTNSDPLVLIKQKVLN